MLVCTLGSLENFRISWYLQISGHAKPVDQYYLYISFSWIGGLWGPQSCSSRVHSDSHKSSTVKPYKISNRSYCYPLPISPPLCKSQCLQNKAIEDPEAKGQPVACPAELCPFFNGVAGNAVLWTKENHLFYVTNMNNNNLHRRQGSKDFRRSKLYLIRICVICAGAKN